MLLEVQSDQHSLLLLTTVQYNTRLTPESRMRETACMSYAYSQNK